MTAAGMEFSHRAPDFVREVSAPLAHEKTTRHTLDEGHDAVPVMRADDRVHFPVADLPAPLDDGRTFGDVTLAGEAATLLRAGG